jgi:hypothetical protein
MSPGERELHDGIRPTGRPGDKLCRRVERCPHHGPRPRQNLPYLSKPPHPAVFTMDLADVDGVTVPARMTIRRQLKLTTDDN